MSRNRYYPFLVRSGNLNGVITDALTILATTTATDYNQIVLLHQNKYDYELIVVAMEAAAHKQQYRKAMLTGLFGRPLRPDRQIKSINVPDVSKEKDYARAVEETRSELVVPINVGNRLIGVINSESEQALHYTETRQKAVEELAIALGSALSDVGFDCSVPEEDFPRVFRLPNRESNKKIALIEERTRTKPLIAQVLDNLAMFADNPGSLPEFTVLSGKQKGETISDADKLEALRCVLRHILFGPGTDFCNKQMNLYGVDRLPVGWLHVGLENDVPLDARFVVHFDFTYVWVMQGNEALTNFIVIIQRILGGSTS